ncbi:MAG: saccharopine dehydrogenase NADP-binding domain-containing protein, partial [Nannocystaceae bacterium]
MSTTDPSERPFDLIVYGATGFTGGLVADYLARKSALAPERWAIAGRNEAKLQAVKDRLVAMDPALEKVALVVASSDAPDTLRTMTASARA